LQHHTKAEASSMQQVNVNAKSCEVCLSHI